MKEEALYIYRVRHPEYGEADVEAPDRLRAIHAAAKAWGVRWTGIARECTCERLGPAPAPVPEKKPETKRRTARKGGK